jgi:hypothetical protein
MAADNMTWTTTGKMATVAIAAVSGTLWLTAELSKIRENVSEIRTSVARIEERVEYLGKGQIPTRQACNVMNAMDTKLGSP